MAAALVARYGIGARPLVLGAAGLLGVAVPAAYLLFLPADRGGYAPRYASDLIGAHWLATAALVLLALALARMLSGPREPARGSTGACESGSRSGCARSGTSRLSRRIGRSNSRHDSDASTTAASAPTPR